MANTVTSLIFLSGKYVADLYIDLVSLGAFLARMNSPIERVPICVPKPVWLLSAPTFHPLRGQRCRAADP